MALLYQEIMKVPGLTGTWRQRIDQYSQKLYGKKWDGGKDSGINLLSQLSKKNYGLSSSSSSSKPKDPISELASNITNQVKPQEKTFEQMYGSEEKFIGEQKPLIDQGVAEQTQSQFLPQIDEGIANIRSAFANRGLFRSGIRGKEETGFLEDIADEEAKVRQQLYSTRENELAARYAKMQADYEKALEQGSKYSAPSELVSYATQTQPAFQPTGQLSATRYSPIGAYEGEDTGRSRFGVAYQKWYEDRFKKERPDVSYKY